MTTLNNRLQLALLNRRNSKNVLEKGFTLVELMIVIVIVGILSAVALPNFLSLGRAKATEANQKLADSLLKRNEYRSTSLPGISSFGTRPEQIPANHKQMRTQQTPTPRQTEHDSNVAIATPPPEGRKPSLRKQNGGVNLRHRKPLK